MEIEGHKKGDPYPSKIITITQQNENQIEAYYDFENTLTPSPIVTITITDINQTSQAVIKSISKVAVDEVLYWLKNDRCFKQ